METMAVGIRSKKEINAEKRKWSSQELCKVGN